MLFTCQPIRDLLLVLRIIGVRLLLEVIELRPHMHRNIQSRRIGMRQRQQRVLEVLGHPFDALFLLVRERRLEWTAH